MLLFFFEVCQKKINAPSGRAETCDGDLGDIECHEIRQKQESLRYSKSRAPLEYEMKEIV